jgi:hypothetical protein
MPPKVPKNWAWNRRREKAAFLVAEDRKTDEKIAAEVGINRKALWRWKQVEAFQARVRFHVAAQEEAARSSGVANKLRRLGRLNEVVQALLQVRDERAQDPSRQGVPGAGSGLLVRTLKQVGSGATAQVVEEWSIDPVWLRELREYQEAAARELGEWPGVADAGDAPVVALSQIVINTREDAQSYMQRLNATTGLVGVVTAAEPAAPGPVSFRQALAVAAGDQGVAYDGPDGI